MIILELNKVLKNLDGQDMTNEEGKPAILAKIIASNLVGKTPGIEVMKAFNWAQQLWKDNTLELDGPDFDKLYSFIENIDLSNLVKAQILAELKLQKVG